MLKQMQLLEQIQEIKAKTSQDHKGAEPRTRETGAPRDDARKL